MSIPAPTVAAPPFLRRLVLGLICLLCFATAPAEGSTSRTLTLVTLSPSLTETVFAIGAGDQVIGVSAFCKWPEEASRKPKVGGLYNLSTETIIALQPDLVLHTALHDGGIEKLRAAGLKTLHLPVEDTDDVFYITKELGRLLDREEQARAVLAETRRDLAKAKLNTAARKKQRPRVLYVVGHPPGVLRDIYVVGSNNFLNELIVVAGAENAMKDATVRYPLASKEQLIANPPDVIIESGRHDYEETKRLWYDLLAVDGSNGPRIVPLDDAHLAIPGPSVGKAALKLQALIFGEEPPAP